MHTEEKAGKVRALTSMNFIFAVPPQKLAILNDHDEEIVGTAGPYLEGQSVTLTCEAIGGQYSVFFLFIYR